MTKITAVAPSDAKLWLRASIALKAIRAQAKYDGHKIRKYETMDVLQARSMGGPAGVVAYVWGQPTAFRYFALHQ